MMIIIRIIRCMIRIMIRVMWIIRRSKVTEWVIDILNKIAIGFFNVKMSFVFISELRRISEFKLIFHEFLYEFQGS